MYVRRNQLWPGAEFLSVVQSSHSTFISLLLKLVTKHIVDLWPHGGIKHFSTHFFYSAGWKIHSAPKMATKSVVSGEVTWNLPGLVFIKILPNFPSGPLTFTQVSSFIQSVPRTVNHMGAAILHRWGHFQLEFVQVWSCGATELILGSCSRVLNCN